MLYGKFFGLEFCTLICRRVSRHIVNGVFELVKEGSDEETVDSLAKGQTISIRREFPQEPFEFQQVSLGPAISGRARILSKQIAKDGEIYVIDVPLEL